MAVKDLVSRYESRAGPSSPQRPSQPRTQGFRPLADPPRATQRAPGPPSTPSTDSSTIYVSSTYLASSEDGTISDTLYNATTDTHDTPPATTDVTEEYFNGRKFSNTIPSNKDLAEGGFAAYEMQELLKSSKGPKRSGSDLATVRISELPSLSPNKPVAASTVFARGAPPLSFPALDKYIASIPPPSFPTNTNPRDGPTPFPPMDLLANSGKTLEDLEKNSQVLSWWRSRNTLVGSVASLALSITGSSALNSFYSLRGLIDVLQIFALILNTITHKDQGDKWRQLILGTIPNILALNFGTSTRIALGILLVFMAISALVLYLFHRSTSLCCRLGTVEGLQRPRYFKHPWVIVLMSLYLTVVYLPLSTMAMHVLVWSDDLWVVPNPYTNATIQPVILPPLGPAAEFRDPTDFCYTTTMRRNDVNYAPVVIILAVFCLAGLTIWFPIHLHRVIKVVCPKVDPYTELGTRRSNSDMDREYQRLLDRDNNPLNFLYHDYRRGWATYESLYLFAKLTALLVVATIDPDNCVFRTATRDRVKIARQGVLLVTMCCFFALQCFAGPFLNPVSNASEWVSRLNYVLTSAIALCIALNVPGKAALDSTILYIVYVITYGMGLYFTIIGWSSVQRLVKRLARRIDFSIDIFSPRVNLGSSSPHTKRRIWQEAISTLFLTNPECGIPKTQHMNFAQARDSEYPPYLLEFAGTPGERHVENLKILREVGSVAYNQGVATLSGPDSARFQYLQDEIQRHHVGPDCYWRDPEQAHIPGCKRFFGNAWFIPFPPTVVIRYDEGPMAVINELADLKLYVKQNSSHDIRRRREVRMTLRALDGKVVVWPYEFIRPIGARSPLCCCLPGRRYRAQTAIHYRAAIFRIKRHGELLWDEVNLASGFNIELTYAKKVVVDGSVIGLDDDFDLTTPLARFLALNEDAVIDSLPHIETVLKRYRHHMIRDCRAKAETLSYRFLAFVYDRPQEPSGLTQSSIETERDPRVKKLMLASENIFRVTYERMVAAQRNQLTTWWYIFWDDLWRRNCDTIKPLKTYATDFDPHSPLSIAYTPLSRAAFESFLTQRGLYHKKPKWGDVFHSGFLNKMYLRMNDVVFHGKHQADIIHLGADTAEHDMEEVDAQTQARPSTLGTGGGTDHDDESIRARPIYRWEGILEDPLRTHQRHNPKFIAKLGVWLGLTPLWRSGIPSAGLALDVRLDHGRYIVAQDSTEDSDADSEFMKPS